jgi:predicted RNase H-like HicB family nuclease
VAAVTWWLDVPVKREYTVIVEQGENGYLIGTVPALPGCHTQGRTLDELLDRMKEAVELVLEELEEDVPAEPPILGIHRIAV